MKPGTNDQSKVRWCLLAGLLALSTAWSTEAFAQSTNVGNFNATIAPLLARYCTGCHGGENPKNDLSLEFASQQDVRRRLLEDRRSFEEMAERIRSGKMPP